MMSCLQINLSYLYYKMIVLVIFVIKKELCDYSSITYMPQLEHKLDIVSSILLIVLKLELSIL
jgi:hypothetical protein